MAERGELTKEARRIVEESGVSLRQAYRYAAAGREPGRTAYTGTDGKRYHVARASRPWDRVEARRVRYTVAMIEKRASLHGITDSDLAEIEAASGLLSQVIASWREWIENDRVSVTHSVTEDGNPDQ